MSSSEKVHFNGEMLRWAESTSEREHFNSVTVAVDVCVC